MKTLQEALRQKPFEPFRIHIADGRSYPVQHPEFLALNPPGRSVAISLDDGGFHILDLLRITGLEFPANGKGRRRKSGT